MVMLINYIISNSLLHYCLAIVRGRRRAQFMMWGNAFQVGGRAPALHFVQLALILLNKQNTAWVSQSVPQSMYLKFSGESMLIG